MPDYAKAKVYKIVDNTSDKIYIGSTCEPTLARRLADHVQKYKRFVKEAHHFVTSFKVLESGDYDIQLIENFPCNSKDELHAREGHFIRLLECVNKVIPGRSDIDYRLENKSKISTTQKKYRDENMVKVKMGKQAYYNNNKNAISTKSKQKYNCSCGGKYTHANKHIHAKTQHHQSYLQRVAQHEELLAMDTKRIDRQVKRAQELDQVKNMIWKQ